MDVFLVQFIQLAVLTLIGLYAACRVLKYPCGHERTLAGAAVFAGLYSLPLGLVVHVVSPVALYYVLKDPELRPRTPLGVVALTYLFTGLATLMLYHMTR